MKDEVAIIVLAAGNSSRMGTPKQNLLVNETTLLQHSIREALASIAGSVMVILSAETNDIKTIDPNHKLFFLINEGWGEGMASSIRCGVQYLLNNKPLVKSVLLMVCDQPYINTALLDKLITLQEEAGSAIVASRYAGTTGIPAIFSQQLFSELLQLTGDTGAKKIMMKHTNSLTLVDFPLGEIDIDTPDDYTLIQNKERN